MAFHILKICPITNGIPHIENLSHYKWHSTYWKSVPLQMAFHILKICPITNGIQHIENLSHYKWHSTYWKSVLLQTAFHRGPFLGPLLTIIYIKDIHEASSNFKTISYADDTNLISPLFILQLNICQKHENGGNIRISTMSSTALWNGSI